MESHVQTSVSALVLHGGWPQSTTFLRYKEGKDVFYNDVNNSFRLVSNGSDRKIQNYGRSIILNGRALSDDLPCGFEISEKHISILEAYKLFEPWKFTTALPRKLASLALELVSSSVSNILTTKPNHPLSTEELQSLFLHFSCGNLVMNEEDAVAVFKLCGEATINHQEQVDSNLAIDTTLEFLRAVAEQINFDKFTKELRCWIHQLYKLWIAENSSERKAGNTLVRLLCESERFAVEKIKESLYEIGITDYLIENLILEPRQKSNHSLPPPELGNASKKPGTAVSSFRLSLPSVRENKVSIDRCALLVTLKLLLSQGGNDWDDRIFKSAVIQQLWKTFDYLGAMNEVLKPYTKTRLQSNSLKLLIKLILPPACNIAVEFPNLERIGGGRFGSVHHSGNNANTAIKIIEIDEVEKLRRVFQEVSILHYLTECITKDNVIVKLLDFGTIKSSSLSAALSCCIIMEKASCSLLQYRHEIRDAKIDVFEHCLYLFKQTATAIACLHSFNVAHNDIKCTNCLVKKTSSGSISVVIADFGESYLFDSTTSTEFFHDNRGTECIKSPEMLKVCDVLEAQKKPEYDRRRTYECGVTLSSDVWSLGCLLYELITDGDFLYEEAQHLWAKFFVRLTKPQEGLDVIPEGKLEVLRNQLSEKEAKCIENLLRFILVRDQRRRPTALAVCHRLKDQGSDMIADWAEINFSP